MHEGEATTKSIFVNKTRSRNKNNEAVTSALELTYHIPYTV